MTLNIPPVCSSTITPKKRILCWSDHFAASTGFGLVSKQVLKALHSTGEYEIDQLAINHTGQLIKSPINTIPARLQDPKDPYGNQMFIDSLLQNDYDIVLIINDAPVVEQVARRLPEIKQIRQAKGMKNFNLVFHYPVDCRLLPETCSMINQSDLTITYSDYARRSTLQIKGVREPEVIYQGPDPALKPLSKEEIKHWRKAYLNVTDDDTFVFINVNRNSIRKDIGRSILAFHKFREQVTKNCIFYIHAKVIDGTNSAGIIDLSVPVKELNLGDSVRFPPKEFHPAKGFPVEILNRFYNAADVSISTNLGGGYEYQYVDSMAVGVPVIAPNHTSAMELIGSNLPKEERRGYLYGCKEKILVELSGFRPFAHLDDIVAQMKNAYEDWQDSQLDIPSQRDTIISNGLKFTKKHSVNNAAREWVSLFSQLEPKSWSQQQGEIV